MPPLYCYSQVSNTFMPYWLNQFHHWSVNLSRAMSPSDNLLEPFVLRSCPSHQGMEWRWSSLWNTSTIIDPGFDQESGSCGILWSEWSAWSLFCGVFCLTFNGSCHAFYCTGDQIGTKTLLLQKTSDQMFATRQEQQTSKSPVVRQILRTKLPQGKTEYWWVDSSGKWEGK